MHRRQMFAGGYKRTIGEWPRAFHNRRWNGKETTMLRNVKDLRGYAIHATDGVIGHVDDFYFDDEAWAIRYLVVETGTWLPRRQVLISPLSIGHPDWSAQLLPVSLTKAQVRDSPDIDTRVPVSRQHEATYHRY